MTKAIYKIVASIFLIVLSLTAVSGCFSKKANIVDEIKKDGILRVVVSDKAGVYARKNAEGDWEGIDIDIIREVASELEVGIDFATMLKTNINGNFYKTRAHVAVGRITDSGALKNKYAPSISHGMGRMLCVTRRGVYFPTLDALSDSTVGVTDELSGLASIAINGVKKINVKEYEDLELVKRSLVSGDLKAFLCYDDKIPYFIRSSELQIQDLFGIEQEQYVFLCQKTDRELLKVINLVITRMVESGQLTAIYNKYPE